MLCIGKVKFFSGEKGVGFLKPEGESARQLKEAFRLKESPSKVRIFLLKRCFSAPLENVPGKLELGLAGSGLPCELPFITPANGEELVVRVIKTRRGLLAANWTPLECWQKASGNISRRLSSDQMAVRLVMRHPETGKLTETIWEGPYSLYLRKLNDGFPEVRRPGTEVQTLRAHGWHKESHPSVWHKFYMPKEVSHEKAGRSLS